ncbi:MAG: hypothetical protein HQL82_04760 [Magnetococcales bacterium]|nr:hypothetical protein [Magnetococcales bacterium]
MNFTDPTKMTTDQRMEEAAAILSIGVTRLLQKRKTEKIPLDKSPGTRPYVRKTHCNGERT